jgi:D-glycero-alpha-D-manno-heptose-7-phosphate kinase
MIISSAPMRISFAGGGTDLSDFYTRYTGRAISTAIDKFIFIAINHVPLKNYVAARYSVSEEVSRASELKNTRIREALVDLGIEKNIEIASFAPIPARTGLGSSSSFSVALMQGLHAYVGRKLDKREVAEAACRLEIDLVKEPIGKQDQYAAAFGGFNVLQFNADGTVDVEPVLLDYKKRMDFEKHLILFFLGTTRDASYVLKEQKTNTAKNVEILKRMSDSVPVFKEALLRADFQGAGEMLLEGWTMKKQLASAISTAGIDTLYDIAMKRGAWGGKILGAGGGGCLMMLAPLERREAVVDALMVGAKAEGFDGACEIPVGFVQTGAEILTNSHGGSSNGRVHSTVLAKGDFVASQPAQGRDR